MLMIMIVVVVAVRMLTMDTYDDYDDDGNGDYVEYDRVMMNGVLAMMHDASECDCCK